MPVTQRQEDIADKFLDTAKHIVFQRHGSKEHQFKTFVYYQARNLLKSKKLVQRGVKAGIGFTPIVGGVLSAGAEWVMEKMRSRSLADQLKRAKLFEPKDDQAMRQIVKLEVKKLAELDKKLDQNLVKANDAGKDFNSLLQMASAELVGGGIHIKTAEKLAEALHNKNYYDHKLLYLLGVVQAIVDGFVESIEKQQENSVEAQKEVRDLLIFDMDDADEGKFIREAGSMEESPLLPKYGRSDD